MGYDNNGKRISPLTEWNWGLELQEVERKKAKIYSEEIERANSSQREKEKYERMKELREHEELLKQNEERRLSHEKELEEERQKFELQQELNRREYEEEEYKRRLELEEKIHQRRRFENWYASISKEERHDYNKYVEQKQKERKLKREADRLDEILEAGRQSRLNGFRQVEKIRQEADEADRLLSIITSEEIIKAAKAEDYIKMVKTQKTDLEAKIKEKQAIIEEQGLILRQFGKDIYKEILAAIVLFMACNFLLPIKVEDLFSSGNIDFSLLLFSLFVYLLPILSMIAAIFSSYKIVTAFNIKNTQNKEIKDLQIELDEILKNIIIQENLINRIDKADLDLYYKHREEKDELINKLANKAERVSFSSTKDTLKLELLEWYGVILKTKKDGSKWVRKMRKSEEGQNPQWVLIPPDKEWQEVIEPDKIDYIEENLRGLFRQELFNYEDEDDEEEEEENYLDFENYLKGR